MSFFAKLAIFFALLLGLLWLLHRFPDSAVSRAAFAWRGPTPENGERLARFLARRALFALKWFGQILLVFCILWLVVLVLPGIGESSLFLLFWFALPLLGGTMLLASAIYACAALKQHVFGPNPTFELTDQGLQA